MNRTGAWRRPVGAAVGALGVALLALGPWVAASALPPTIAARAPFLVVQELLVLVPAPPAVRVEELVSGINHSSRPVSGLAFPLPAHAIGAALQSGAPAAAFRVRGREMRLAVTVPAGAAVSYAFTFTESWAGGALWLPVGYPTAQLSAALPQGRWSLRGPGFSPAGPLPVGQGLTMQAYTTVAPTPGALLPVRVAPVHPWNRTWVRWALEALLVLGAGAWGLLAVRRRRRRRSLAAAGLVDAVARLDLAHLRGEVSGAPYLEGRQRLLEELEALHGG